MCFWVVWKWWLCFWVVWKYIYYIYIHCSNLTYISNFVHGTLFYSLFFYKHYVLEMIVFGCLYHEISLYTCQSYIYKQTCSWNTLYLNFLLFFSTVFFFIIYKFYKTQHKTTTTNTIKVFYKQWLRTVSFHHYLFLPQQMDKVVNLYVPLH